MKWVYNYFVTGEKNKPTFVFTSGTKLVKVNFNLVWRNFWLNKQVTILNIPEINVLRSLA
jgi:hypothetical protein